MQPSQSVRQQLRHAIHRLHHQLNQHPLLSGLVRPGYSLSRYKTVLTAYFHSYQRIETAIETGLADPAFAAAPFRYSERRKLPWLVADLRHFGLDPQAPEHRPIHPPTVSVPAGPGSLIGTLYVIEGATLGGQVIARGLRDNLNLTAATGIRFFNGYGDEAETGRRWREFEQYADSVNDNPDELQRAEDAAIRIFGLINDQLNDYYSRLVR